VAVVRFFAQAKDAAGCGRSEVPGATVAQVLSACSDRFGTDLAAIIDTSRIWVNGEFASADTPVVETDEVAVLPPVSGG
jgi:molybdopterin synthase sulfur carrier subunit